MGSWFLICIGIVNTINVIISMIKATKPLLIYLSYLHQLTIKKAIIVSSKKGNSRNNKINKLSIQGRSLIELISGSSTRHFNNKNVLTSIIKHYDT